MDSSVSPSSALQQTTSTYQDLGFEQTNVVLNELITQLH